MSARILITKILSVKTKIVLVVLLLFFVAIPVAQAFPGLPLVPCGLAKNNDATPGWDDSLPCNQCQLFQLAKNIIDFLAFGLIPILAGLLFTIGGLFILLGGAVPSQYKRGIDIFKNTLIGLLVLYASWLITNTIIVNLQEGNKTAAEPWYKFTCTAVVGGGTTTPPVTGTKFACNPDTLACEASDTGFDTEDACNTACQAVQGEMTITSPTNLQEAQVSKAYSQQLTAKGGEAPYAWFLEAGQILPPGLDLSETGVISGTPTQVGSWTFKVTAVDKSQQSLSAEASLTIKVLEGGLTPLKINVFTIVVPEEGKPYNIQLGATGGQQPYSWKLSGGQLPPDLKLDTKGLISGFFTTYGHYVPQITVTDSLPPPQGPNTDSTSINFNFMLPIVITPTSLPDGQIGKVYPATTLKATGGASPYTWSLRASTPLPDGLTFNASTSTISGTPTKAGTFNFAIDAKDAVGGVANTNYKIIVTDGTTTGLTCPVAGLIKNPNGCPGAGSCPDCIPINGTPIQANGKPLEAAQTMADFLNNKMDPAFRQAGVSYRIAEAMCPTAAHYSCAHFNGHAVDIGQIYDANQLKAACQALNNLGLTGKTGENSADRGTYVLEVSSPGLPCPQVCGGIARKCGNSPIHLQY